MYRRSDPRWSSHRQASRSHLQCKHSSSPTLEKPIRHRKSAGCDTEHRPAPGLGLTVHQAVFFHLGRRCSWARRIRKNSRWERWSRRIEKHAPEYSPSAKVPGTTRGYAPRKTGTAYLRKEEIAGSRRGNPERVWESWRHQKSIETIQPENHYALRIRMKYKNNTCNNATMG